MPRGLFELRKDSITGWWVAVVVDREFQKERFHRAGAARRQPTRGLRRTASSRPADASACACSSPTLSSWPARSARRRRDEDGREPEPGPARRVGQLADDRRATRPPRVARGDDAADRVRDARAHARRPDRPRATQEKTEYLQVVQNFGRQAGALTDHLCLDFYDLPQIPHRIGEELGGAARFVIREGICPFCRLVRDEVADPERLVYEDAASVCFRAIRAAARRSSCGSCRATTMRTSAPPRTPSSSARRTRSQRVLRLLSTLGGPAYNLILHTAPLRERVDETYHWHWEIHPRLREIAGLELGTGLPVNPVVARGGDARAARHRQRGGASIPALPVGPALVGGLR